MHNKFTSKYNKWRVYKEENNPYNTLSIIEEKEVCKMRKKIYSLYSAFREVVRWLRNY